MSGQGWLRIVWPGGRWLGLTDAVFGQCDLQALCKERNVPWRSDVTLLFFYLFFGLEPRMPIVLPFQV